MAVNKYLFHADERGVADEGTEAQIQRRFLNQLRHEPDVRAVAFPNSGKRTAWEGRQRQLEGMSKGVPDLLILWDGRSAFIEFKDKKGSLKPEQIAWLNWLKNNGLPCGMFRSSDTAMTWLRELGAVK
jgi:hypothetical protein